MPQDLNVRKFLPPIQGANGQAGSSFYEVTISNGNDLNVGGQMKENFGFQLQAEYAKLMSGVIPFSELFKKLGNTQLTTGIFSRKYYTGGNHLQMNVDFRIFEDYGTAAVPDTTKNNKSTEIASTSKIVKASKDLSKLMTADPNSIGNIKFVGELYDKSAAATKQVINDPKKAAMKGFKRIVDNMNKRTVILNIGTFFTHSEMVITSLDVSYSRELTRIGPLYADFKVSLESIEAMDSGKFGSNGVLKNSNINRITFETGQ